MSPDDPRHGSSAGYVAGCRCEPCHVARRRYQKAHRLALLNGDEFLVPADTVHDILRPWLQMGISRTAVTHAASVMTRRPIEDVRHVRASTYRALAAVTEDDFDDSCLVFADLTRRRIYSLMAAGHQLIDMPINPRGKWRDRERITIGFARKIRSHYLANECKEGPSAFTAARAKNNGHVVPAAWDDPGTLAWPIGYDINTNMDYEARNLMSKDVDPVVVERILSGDTSLRSTVAEKREVVRLWRGSHNELERLTGWNVHRYLDRSGGDAGDAADLHEEEEGAA